MCRDIVLSRYSSVTICYRPPLSKFNTYKLCDPGYGILDADWAFWMFNSIGIIYVIQALGCTCRGERHDFFVDFVPFRWIKMEKIWLGVGV